MTLNESIFKAYDIRGIYGQDFDDDFAKQLGRAYSSFMEAGGKENLTIVVGHDMRLSSPSLKDELISGIAESGVNVIDIGLVSTPAFYFAVAKYGYDGGIMISASHNPKEWNGFKLVKEKAIPISGETGIDDIKKIILENSYSASGEQGVITKKDVIADYDNYCAKQLNLAKIKPMKIVADAANSMGGQYLEQLSKLLPGELIRLNFELDGSFPAHEADPLKEENLEQIKKSILENKADLGIATDGDGDRIFFVDDKGHTINPAIIRGLLAQSFLMEKPGSKIGYDVRPGKITEDLILESGGTPVMTRVGHSLIKEQMLKEDIYFAGESSGHFYLNMEIGCFEAPLIMIFKMLETFSKSNMPISEFVKQYDKYFHSGEINSNVEDKEGVIKKIAEKFGDGKISYLDGITVKYPDFWFNVRGSNTENKMRLNLEATTEEVMEKRRDEILDIINS